MKKKWRLRNITRVLEPAIAEQFEKGRLYAKISTSPGQTGTADGYILEGEELAFYMKKLAIKKKKINNINKINFFSLLVSLKKLITCYINTYWTLTNGKVKSIKSFNILPPEVAEAHQKVVDAEHKN